ncbi:glycosyltransferase [Desulfonatronum parangueonense]
MLLSQANSALRSGELTKAIPLYLDALRNTPGLSQTITGNIALARKKYRAQRQGQKPLVLLCLPDKTIDAAALKVLSQAYQVFGAVECVAGTRSGDWTELLGIPVHRVTADGLEQFVGEHPCDVVHIVGGDQDCLALAALTKLVWGAAVIGQGNVGVGSVDAFVDKGMDAGKLEGIVLEVLGRPFAVGQGLLNAITRRAVLEMYDDLAIPPAPHSSRITHHPSRIAPQGTPIALFWKQNDTTIYGRRHDMVIKYLASRPDISKVIVFDLPISHATLNFFNTGSALTEYKLAYERTQLKIHQRLDTDKIAYRVYVHDDSPTVTQDYLAFIHDVFFELGLRPQDAALWFYPYIGHATEIIEHFKPACVVTDVVDDQRAWPDCSEQNKALFTKNYQDLLARSAFAFCNCLPVKMSMKPLFPKIRLVPNACDANPPAEPVDHPLHARISRKKRPVLGFVGNLEEKMDILLLEKIVRSFPDMDMLLIGSTHINPDILVLDRHDNVHFPGVVPYDQAGTWISLFDVALIPHLNMDMTRSMNPLKLYSYLAWNVPVVCTDIPNIDKSSGMVFPASSHEEFIARLQDILEKRVDLPDIGFWRKKNTWQSRFEAHVDEIVRHVCQQGAGNSGKGHRTSNARATDCLATKTVHMLSHTPIRSAPNGFVPVEFSASYSAPYASR